MDVLSNCLLNINVYSHRLVLLSVLAREASFPSGQPSMQSLRTGQRAENKWLLSVLHCMGHLHQPPQDEVNILGEGMEMSYELKDGAGAC